MKRVRIKNHSDILGKIDYDLALEKTETDFFLAHDLNNLLMIIAGYFEFLLEDGVANHERTAIDEIKTATLRGMNLTRQLLTYSGRQIIKPEPIDLNALIKNMEDIFPQLLGEKIKLLLSFENQLGMIKADPGQIQQILINLIINARDAMPHGGTLTIMTKNKIVPASFVGGSRKLGGEAAVALQISDNGIGISAEAKRHLFEPFFTTKQKGKGTGLGLATCYGIAKQSGGNILVSSRLGKGTTFEIYFPTFKTQSLGG